MNRRQIALKLVLDALGIAPTMDSFDQRLALQKTIYLAQQMGVSLGYQFSWYRRGPYSADLTADAFANIGTQLPEGWGIDDGIQAKVAKMRETKVAGTDVPACRHRPTPRKLRAGHGVADTHRSSTISARLDLLACCEPVWRVECQT
jgi:hypothetical protein